MSTPLGQNFLTDETVAQKIARLANIQNANVLEIGAGKGILTKYLAKYAKRVLAVEIDKNLIKYLSSRFRRNDKIRLVAGDILRINLPQLIEKNNFQPYKVVANLPYYITSKIIRLLLETKYPAAEMILTIQKEVGERIVALDGKESILSISVKFYAKPEILFLVSKENFKPVPEVDSAVIKIKRKDKVPNVDNKKFFRIIRAGFSSKRKMLANNLSVSFHIPKKNVLRTLKRAGIDPTVRAEKLAFKNWIDLYAELSKGENDFDS